MTSYMTDAVQDLLSETDFAQRAHKIDPLHDPASLPCGYDSGRGCAEVSIPKSWRDLPFGDEEALRDLTDLEFLYVAQICNSITHFSTDQVHCVASQPLELTYLMNAGRRPGVTQNDETRFVFSRVIAGGASLLLLRAKCLLEGHGRNAKLGLQRLGKILVEHGTRGYFPSDDASISMHDAECLRSIARQALDAYTGRQGDAFARLRGTLENRNGPLPQWLRGVREILEKHGIALTSAPILPAKILKSTLSLNSQARVLKALSEFEDPKRALHDLTVPSNVLGITRRDEATSELIDSIRDLSFPGLPGGGYAQREEHRRMKAKGWPHIMSSTRTGKKPSVTVSYGEIRVHGLEVLKSGSTDLSQEQARDLLVDSTGTFLPYEDMVANLREALDEFSDSEEELASALQLAEETAPGCVGHSFNEDFRSLLDKEGLDPAQFWGAECRDESVDLLTEEGGEDDVAVLEMSFHVGPDEYSAWCWETDADRDEGDAQSVVFDAARFRIYDSYSDYTKTCWLQHRGLILASDSVGSNGGPEELSPAMRQDFLDWCNLVVTSDGPWNELNTYDGDGNTYSLGSHEFAIWRSG